MSDTKNTFLLTDSTIAQIARCLQVAILTGTDIADNLRQLELEVKDNGKIGATKEYLNIFNNNIEKMLQNGPSTDVGQQLTLDFD